MTIKFRTRDKHIFYAIKRGEKTVETRANSPLNQKVQKGDELMLVCGQESCVKTVAAVHQFVDANELAMRFDMRIVMPGAESVDALRQLHESIPGYQDKVARYGLVAWELVDS